MRSKMDMVSSSLDSDMVMLSLDFSWTDWKSIQTGQSSSEKAKNRGKHLEICLEVFACI